MDSWRREGDSEAGKEGVKETLKRGLKATVEERWRESESLQVSGKSHSASCHVSHVPCLFSTSFVDSVTPFLFLCPHWLCQWSLLKSALHTCFCFSALRKRWLTSWIRCKNKVPLNLNWVIIVKDLLNISEILQKVKVQTGTGSASFSNMASIRPDQHCWLSTS